MYLDYIYIKNKSLGAQENSIISLENGNSK